MTTENLTLAQFYGTQRNPYNYAKIEQVGRDLQTAWLTLDEITNQLNLFGDESQDTYLSSIELAARMSIEDYLGLAIFPTQYKVYYGYGGLSGTAVYLDLPEVSAGVAGVTINTVAYYSDTNVLTTLSSTYYYYDPTGNRVVITGMPNTISQYVANPIVVTYTQNPDFISQYPVIKQAGLLMLTHLYNNRSMTSDTALKEIPYGVAQLLRPYKPLVM
jgi:hypothetical protein